MSADAICTDLDSFRKLGEAVSLCRARYTLFTKRRLEGENLPPTKDTFGFHISRAFFQLSTWNSACIAIANNLDPLHHGWQLENDILTGKITEQKIAPLEVVELVACKCREKKLCCLGTPKAFYLFNYKK